MGQSKYNVQTLGTNAAGSDGTTLSTVNDAVIFDVRDQSNVACWVNRAHTGTSATVRVDVSIDGTNFAELGTVQDSDITVAGAGAGKYLTISDANGMWVPVLYVKCTLTAVVGGCTYTCATSGAQRDGNR